MFSITRPYWDPVLQQYVREFEKASQENDLQNEDIQEIISEIARDICFRLPHIPSLPDAGSFYPPSHHKLNELVTEDILYINRLITAAAEKIVPLSAIHLEWKSFLEACASDVLHCSAAPTVLYTPSR